MEELIVEDGRADAKTAETLLREYMRAHLEDVGARFGTQMNVSDALAADLAALREPEQQAWGMLVAWSGTTPLGCVVLEALPDDAVELKRLYVRPAHRGAGVGRHLVACAIEAARMAGAVAVRLNTQDTAESALALYEALGFTPVPAYPGHAVPAEHHGQWVFMELPLPVLHLAAD